MLRSLETLDQAVKSYVHAHGICRMFSPLTSGFLLKGQLRNGRLWSSPPCIWQRKKMKFNITKKGIELKLHYIAKGTVSDFPISPLNLTRKAKIMWLPTRRGWKWKIGEILIRCVSTSTSLLPLSANSWTTTSSHTMPFHSTLPRFCLKIPL